MLTSHTTQPRYCNSIREDTAKYLLNLDVKSAYYDPKTRSMRENPFAGTAKEAQGVCPRID